MIYCQHPPSTIVVFLGPLCRTNSMLSKVSIEKKGLGSKILLTPLYMSSIPNIVEGLKTTYT